MDTLTGELKRCQSIYSKNANYNFEIAIEISRKYKIDMFQINIET